MKTVPSKPLSGPSRIPLLEDVSITGAKGVLMNITSTSDLTMEEMTEASDRIYNEVGEDADIIWGTVVDDSLGDEMRVTVIATGIGGSAPPEEAPVKIVDETLRRQTAPGDGRGSETYGGL